MAIAGCHRMLDREPAAHNWAAGFAQSRVPNSSLSMTGTIATRQAFR